MISLMLLHLFIGSIFVGIVEGLTVDYENSETVSDNVDILMGLFLWPFIIIILIVSTVVKASTKG